MPLLPSPAMWGSEVQSWRSLPPLISAAQLSEIMCPPSQKYPLVRLLDATWLRLPIFKGRDARKEFMEKRIADTLHCDIDVVADTNVPWPHMLPDADTFVDKYAPMLELEDTRQWTVCYDKIGVFSSCRLKWMLEALNFENVSVLQGGFSAYEEEGWPVDKEELTPEQAVARVKGKEEQAAKWDKVQIFDAGAIDGRDPPPFKQQVKLIKKKVATYDEVKSLITQASATLASSSHPLILSSEEEKKNPTKKITLPTPIIDARPRGRFDGTQPEPREGIPSGHIPGSVNVPFLDVLTEDWKMMRTPEEIKKAFEKAGVKVEDIGTPTLPFVILTCGSGATACVLDVALAACGVPSTARRVFDGSWTEWATRQMNKGSSWHQETK